MDHDHNKTIKLHNEKGKLLDTGEADKQESSTDFFHAVEDSLERMNAPRHSSLYAASDLASELDQVTVGWVAREFFVMYGKNWPHVYKQSLLAIKSDTTGHRCTAEHAELALHAFDNAEEQASLLMRYFERVFAPGAILSYAELETYLAIKCSAPLLEGLLLLAESPKELAFFKRWNVMQEIEHDRERELEAKVEELKAQLKANKEHLKKAKEHLDKVVVKEEDSSDSNSDSDEDEDMVESD